MDAEAQDILYAPCLGRRLEAAEVRVVAVEDCGGAGLHAGKDLRLGVGDLVGRGEEGAVYRLDGGDKGDVGPRQPGQGLDLAGMVHAHLEDAEAGVFGHARQTEGQAPVVVETALAGAGRPLFAEDQLQGLLGAGLADASGDPDDPRLGSETGVPRQLAQGLQRIADHHQRRVRGDARRHVGDDGPGDIMGQGVGDERVAVEVGSLERHEEVAGPPGAAVYGNPGGVERCDAPSTSRRRRLGAGPQHPSLLSGHGASSSTAARATSASSKGCVSEPTI